MNDQVKIPCMFIRGGTSRGPYFLKSDLPSDINKRDKILLAAMGSPDLRQIDGLGGAFASYFLEIAFGFDFLPTFLSFVPGGIHEMVIISVAYNIDPIFVSYHHFLRIILIVLLIPFIIKKFNHNE